LLNKKTTNVCTQDFSIGEGSFSYILQALGDTSKSDLGDIGFRKATSATLPEETQK